MVKVKNLIQKTVFLFSILSCLPLMAVQLTIPLHYVHSKNAKAAEQYAQQGNLPALEKLFEKNLGKFIPKSITIEVGEDETTKDSFSKQVVKFINCKRVESAINYQLEKPLDLLTPVHSGVDTSTYPILRNRLMVFKKGSRPGTPAVRVVDEANRNSTFPEYMYTDGTFLFVLILNDKFSEAERQKDEDYRQSLRD